MHFLAASRQAGYRPATGCLYGMVAELGEWGEGRLIRKASGEAGHQLHILLQVETTRGTGSHIVVIHREMTIAVGIGAGWSDMRWVEDVGINKGELRSVSAILKCGFERYSHLS